MCLYIEHPPELGGSWVAVSDNSLVAPIINILTTLNPKDEHIVELELIGQCVIHTDDIDNFISIASSLGLDVVEICIAKDIGFHDTISSLNLPIYHGSAE